MDSGLPCSKATRDRPTPPRKRHCTRPAIEELLNKQGIRLTAALDVYIYMTADINVW